MTTLANNTQTETGRGRIFLTLFLSGLVGVITFLVGTVYYVLPDLVLTMGDDAQQLPPNAVIILLGTVQLGVLLALSTWAGLALSRRMNVNITPLLTGSIRDRRLVWGIASGIAAGIAMLIAHQFIFLPMTGIPINVSAEMPPALGLATVFLYGGFTEEVLMRLGLTTLLLWIGSKVQSDSNGTPTLTIFWIVNLIVAILFGLLHLPSAVMLQGVVVSPIVVMQALVLNAVSLLFSWLYWHRGIETAMAAHVGVHIGYTLLAMIAF